MDELGPHFVEHLLAYLHIVLYCMLYVHEILLASLVCVANCFTYTGNAVVMAALQTMLVAHSRYQLSGIVICV